MGRNTNIQDRLSAIVANDVEEIFQISDFVNVSLPAITLENKSYMFNNTISPGEQFQFSFPQLNLCRLESSNTLTSTIISVVAIDAFFQTEGTSGNLSIRLDPMTIIYGGAPAGSVWMNLSFVPPSVAASLGQVTVLTFESLFALGFETLGTVTNAEILGINRLFAAGFDNGLVLQDVREMSIDATEFRSNQSGNGSAITLQGNIGVVSINTCAFLMGASESFLRIDPAIPQDARITITNVFSRENGSSLFDTSGTEGPFTSVSDGTPASTPIPSVSAGSTLNGAIAASFENASAPFVVGESVILSGFTGANIGYNGTHLVTASSGSQFECLNVVFALDGTGTLDRDIITITSTAHALSNGDTITLDTVETLPYDGGATLFDVTTNTFNINRSFIFSVIGTWSTRGLDQTDNRVNAFANPGFMESMSIGAIGYNNSGGGTVSIASAGVAVPISNAGAISWVQFDSTERFKATANGQLIYVGVDPVTFSIEYSAEMNSPITDENQTGIVLQFSEVASPTVYVTDTDSINTLTPKAKETIFQVTGFFIKVMNFGDRLRLAVINESNSDNIDVYAARVTISK